MEIKPKKMYMAAINRTLDIAIPSSAESFSPSKRFVNWGDSNTFPNYLHDLYLSATDLKTCVDGLADYIAGDDVRINLSQGYINKDKLNRRDSAFDVIHNAAIDMALYNGCAFQVIRSARGVVNEIYNIDFRNLRSNKDNDVFYYSENWDAYSRNKKIEYPSFHLQGDVVSSIVYIKGDDVATYPVPICLTAVKSCEIEKRIDDYHLNSLENGFAASYLINFNNGQPEDTEKEEIERMFNAKFSGSENAGRIIFSWNDSKETSATIEKMELQDFGERYQQLAKWSRQTIYSAFRANPNLFGIPTDSLGFSSEEYESAFRLFNRTRVRPLQRKIVKGIESILGDGSITIRPFSLEESNEHNVE